MSRCALTLVISFFYGASNLNLATAAKSTTPYLDTQKKDTITIGLLVENLENGQEAILAAQLAINQTNQSAGSSGKWFKLAYRTTDGLWGQASNMTVELIFKEKAVAIVGALDGRTAHLAEQVTAKSHIPYIETRATDPTLSKAFVPWFFRLSPNDYQISQALVKEIYDMNRFSKVVIISDSTYDGEMASSTFKKYIAVKNIEDPSYIFLDDQNVSQTSTISKLKAESFQAIVFLTHTVNQNPKLLAYLRQSSARIYHTRFLVEQRPPMVNYSYQTISAVADSSKYEKLNMQFQKNANLAPSAQVIYTYDAINLLLSAITTVGAKPEIIGQYLGKMGIYNGVSGQIEFDDNGNLMRSIQLILVK